jgi:hypothetical protein
MMLWSQLVLLPLLLVFAWGYFVMLPPAARTAATTAYDTGVILAAVIASVLAGWLVVVRGPQAESSIWGTVMLTVSTFHVFPAVLLVGLYLRRRIFP